MSQDAIDRNTLKQYLLGELSQETQLEAVEERLFTDDDVFEELQLVKEDLIDQYVKDEFTPAERRNFERNFLTTEERRADVRRAQALAGYAGRKMAELRQSQEKKLSKNGDRSRPRWWWLPRRLTPAGNSVVALPLNPAWAFVVVILVTAALSFVVWRGFFYQSDLQRGLLALKSTYRLQRPVESRLTALDYAPLPNTRGNGNKQIDTLSQERAERLLRDAQNDDPGAASDHALGLYYVTQLKFDQAIPLLKKAVEAQPNDAQFQSDLGAALIEKAKLDKQNGDQAANFTALSESLEHLNRALALNPSLLEALFNRALCRQYLQLPEKAAEDWRLYLTKDSQSNWADEARDRLKELEAQTSKVSQNKDAVQSFLAAYSARDDEIAWQVLSLNRDSRGGLIENQLLDKYLNLEQANEAQGTFAALAYASELQLKRADDRFAADLVRFYQSPSPAARKLLLEARALTSQANQSLRDIKPEDAFGYCAQAKEIFDKLGDKTESMYLDYLLAHAYLGMHKSEQALTSFQAVVRNSEVAQYQWLLSQALSGAANAQLGLNDYSAALETNKRAQQVSERIGDVKGLMKTADQLSILYTRLGNYPAAIEHQAQGLALMNQFVLEPAQAWRSNFLMATPLHLMGLDAAAEDFEQESLRVAKATTNPYNMCRSYIGLGVIYGSQQKYDEAIQNVHAAFDLARTISSEETRKDALAYSSLQLGHLYRQAGDFGNAMASYDDVLKTYDDAVYPAFVYAARKGKLLSCIAQGGCPSVDHDIETTLDLFEGYRAKIREEANNFVFFDAEQNVYDAVIGYEHSVNPSSPLAFDLSERSRARTLLDQANGNSAVASHHAPMKPVIPVTSVPLTSAQIRQQMPVESQILQYSVLPQKVLIWFLSRTNMRVFEQSIAATDLHAKVSRYLQLLSAPPVNNEAEVAAAGAEFYDLLIKPAEGELDRHKQLCLIPDKSLNDLPFAAFVSRASGKSLVEDYVLTRAPSATVFMVSTDNAQRSDSVVDEQLLSVGNPRFDHAAFPMLGDLSSSKREAEEIARLYNSQPAIVEQNATKNRVVAEMAKANVVHLAMHAVVDEHSPLRSKLVFAKDELSQNISPDAATLSIGEIDGISMPDARLVVLSACQSAAGRYYDGEGVIGISRPFIAKGVPLVVASLWPVDSDATAELMIAFHRNRKRAAHSTAEALALAQRAMLGGPDPRYRHPYYWAPFVTIGGYARF
ncbi:MAG TPA: CHAT domain-containing protein [Pyrinomonadaceae bacterium]